jgi:hypothetical protein
MRPWRPPHARAGGRDLRLDGVDEREHDRGELPVVAPGEPDAPRRQVPACVEHEQSRVGQVQRQAGEHGGAEAGGDPEARVSPCTVALSSLRSTMWGSWPRPRRSTSSVNGPRCQEISGMRASWASDGSLPADGGRWRAAMNRNGSRSSSRASNGPSTGSSTNATSVWPAASRSSCCAWGASSSRTSTSGWLARSRRSVPGSRRAAALWNVPTETLPASPAASAVRSASVARSSSSRWRAWRSTRSPAGVGTTGWRPPRRSSSRLPAIRSSPAICRLTADWV